MLNKTKPTRPNERTNASDFVTLRFIIQHISRVIMPAIYGGRKHKRLIRCAPSDPEGSVTGTERAGQPLFRKEVQKCQTDFSRASFIR